MSVNQAPFYIIVPVAPVPTARRSVARQPVTYNSLAKHSRTLAQGALSKAILGKDVAEAKRLMKSSASIALLNAHGNSMFHDFARLNDQASLTFMVHQLGADPNIKNKDGNTILHQLALQKINMAPKKENALLGFIIQKLGADPNISNDKDLTPLHMAVKTRKHHLVRALGAQHQADVNFKSVYGSTPLNSAVYKRDLEMVKLLANEL